MKRVFRIGWLAKLELRFLLELLAVYFLKNLNTYLKSRFICTRENFDSPSYIMVMNHAWEPYFEMSLQVIQDFRFIWRWTIA